MWFRYLRTYGTDVCTGAVIGGVKEQQEVRIEKERDAVSSSAFEAQAKAAAATVSSGASPQAAGQFNAAHSGGSKTGSSSLSLHTRRDYIGGRKDLQADSDWQQSVSLEPAVLSHHFISMHLFAPRGMRDSMRQAIDDFVVCRGDDARLPLRAGLPAVIQEQTVWQRRALAGTKARVDNTSPPLSVLAPTLQCLCSATLQDVHDPKQFHAALRSLGYRLLAPPMSATLQGSPWPADAVRAATQNAISLPVDADLEVKRWHSIRTIELWDFVYPLCWSLY